MSFIQTEDTQQMSLAKMGEELPGTPYRVVKKLGGGGMGQVYQGEHMELGREVAIKLLAPQLAEDKEAMERLRREARAAARIGHPHIIDTYDMGVTDDGRPYVVMRNIRGCDLKKILDEEAPLSPKRVLHIASQIGSALTAAHKVGIIHRDLKPENVMVETEGRVAEHVTVLDFGIAQSIQDSDTRLTRAGQVIGTPGYLSPEQALAKPLDGRSDEYGLAVICYELLSGDSPYPRNTPLQVIAAQLTQVPRDFKAEVDEGIRAVVMKGMSREADDRYADVDVFIEALRLAVEAADAGQAKPKGGALKIIAPLALVGAAALGGVGYFAMNPQEAAVSASRDAAVDAGLVVDAAPVIVDAAPVIVDAAPVIVDAAPVIVDAAPVKKVTRKKPKRSVKRKRSKKAAPEKPKPEPEKPKPEPEKPKPEPKPEPPKVAPAASAQVAPAPPKKKRPGRLVFRPIQVKGGASKRRISKRLKAARGGVRACAAGLVEGLSAEITFTIDSDGFFENVGGRGDPKLLACGVKGIKKLRRLKRRPDTGHIEVTVPLKMEAE